MIDAESILDNVKNHIALWCGGGEETDLAASAFVAMDQNVDMVSVLPGAVATLWPWLERTRIKIMARFYVGAGGDVSDLSRRINMTFKSGAHGAQVFLSRNDLDNFVDELHLIREDLFFNHDLAIGLDVSEINSDDWVHVFDALNKIRANSLILVLPRDDGDRSDFVGRIYAAMNAWGMFGGALHFALGANFIRIDQAARLVSDMQPVLYERMRFFVPHQ